MALQCAGTCGMALEVCFSWRGATTVQHAGIGCAPRVVEGLKRVQGGLIGQTLSSEGYHKPNTLKPQQP